MNSQAMHIRSDRLLEARQTMPPWCGWGPILLLPTSVLLFAPAAWPRWLFMWVLAFAIFLGCKWLSWRRTPVPGLPWWQHAAYLLAWPGLDARAFLRAECLPCDKRPTLLEWLGAGFKFLLGIALFWGAASLVPRTQDILLGWLGMVGLILMLHFGLFHLLSCGWRAVGIEARPNMNNPLASVSLSAFWGQRWNTAFRDFTHRFVFRPLTAWMPPWGAVVAAFVFSGLIHDLVISVPAGAGYGWPTLYFVIQAFGLFAERSRFGQRVGLGHGWRGHLFTLIVLTSPAFGLFHPPFIQHVIVPFMKTLGAG